MIIYVVALQQSCWVFVESPTFAQARLNIIQDPEHGGTQGTGIQELLHVLLSRDAYRMEGGSFHWRCLLRVKDLGSGFKKTWT